MNSSPRNHRAAPRAFTLVELLTVIAIVGILAAIIIPVVGSVRKSAASARALSNVKQLGMTNLLYAQDNKNQIFGRADDMAIQYKTTQAMYRSMTQYLAKAPVTTNNDPQTINTLRLLLDPLVPEEYSCDGPVPFTWSINRLFNINSGRIVDGTGTWNAGPAGNPRRMPEFSKPTNTIFAVSGNWELTTANAQDAKLLSPPAARQAIFYYHGNNNSTPAVFLDGHTEMLAYPIALRRINPSLPN